MLEVAVFTFRQTSIDLLGSESAPVLLYLKVFHTATGASVIEMHSLFLASGVSLREET